MQEIIYPNYIPNEKELAKSINMRTYVNIVDRLQLIATSIFTWKNLDDVAGTGASRFLEQVLFVYGRACFVKDDTKGYMALKVNPSAKINIYNLPTRVNAFSYEYNKDYPFDDIVYIMNNELEMPTLDTALFYAWRLYEIERTTDVNINSQKTPIMLETDAKGLLTLKNVYMQYSGNMPIIYANKDFNLGSKVNSINTQAPYITDKLDIHKEKVMNEYLEFLGINYSGSEKKERLLTEEIQSNKTSSFYNLNMFYKTRKKAVQDINKKYGLNIEIELNKEIQDLISYSESSQADLKNGVSGTINPKIYKDDTKEGDK